MAEPNDVIHLKAETNVKVAATYGKQLLDENQELRTRLKNTIKEYSSQLEHKKKENRKLRMQINAVRPIEHDESLFGNEVEDETEEIQKRLSTMELQTPNLPEISHQKADVKHINGEESQASAGGQLEAMSIRSQELEPNKQSNSVHSAQPVMEIEITEEENWNILFHEMISECQKEFEKHNQTGAAHNEPTLKRQYLHVNSTKDAANSTFTFELKYEQRSTQKEEFVVTREVKSTNQKCEKSGGALPKQNLSFNPPKRQSDKDISNKEVLKKVTAIHKAIEDMKEEIDDIKTMVGEMRTILRNMQAIGFGTLTGNKKVLPPIF